MNIPHSMDHFGRIPLFFYHTNEGLRAVLPISVLALVAAAVVTWWLLNRTMMGRGVYAMGGSLAIAERLGYNLRAIHLFVFGYTGMLAGIAGILHVSNNRLANPFDLVGSELDVIAAVILGGARITGGSGYGSGYVAGCGAGHADQQCADSDRRAEHLAESDYRCVHSDRRDALRLAAQKLKAER
jgi:simple sugar transport system permease protein